MKDDKWFIKSKNGKERTGVLMKLEENDQSRYEFEVWFEYTRLAMNDIKEGTMLAVPNYATTKEEIHYSILEVTSIKPIHYAIGEDPQGYPGFVLEAAKNAAHDWTGQDDEPTEDTTTIQCTAIPTNLELLERKDGCDFQSEQNIPMVGAVVRILDTEPTKQVVNKDIDLDAEKDSLFVGGKLIRDKKVETFVRIEEFIRVHFGIFGFTGAGKSNLLSTYIANLLTSPKVVKIVLFDLMGEYTVLLLDQLLNKKINGQILTIGKQTLPEGLFKYINQLQNFSDLNTATTQFQKYTLLPKALVSEREFVKQGLQQLIKTKAIRFYQDAQSLTIYDVFFTDAVPWAQKRQKEKFNQRKEIVKKCLQQAGLTGNYQNTHFTPDLAKTIREELEKELGNHTYKDFKDKGDFNNHLAKLKELETTTDIFFAAGTTLDDVVKDLNNDKQSSLWIIQAHNSNELRNFSKRLGEKVYEERRQNGLVDPLVSFIFDEADEFIPSKTNGESYENSKEIVETLARRGRKFGLGIGIATQRTRYLDTSIMAQPHTYLVSKLPRESDRDVVAEAFGVSKDMFRQTFKFKPGNWLLMSHDATGLKAIPVPIQTEDANQRLKEFLKTLT
ncbi:ATPase [Fischerella thermalis CCMEE 5268]|uniref:ATPase n=1 Tax=Fischerella thermalis CCMEE 5268 TaxID=2019662 RepID=A0A2N6KHE7_9CYAN|nr:ATP-binding protein [Fischerella thermalis]PLZ98800.1 ATPase [Fischerella thermalis CCMEE 5268]